MTAIEPQTTREIRSAVEFEIGSQNLEAFERWAFKSYPYTYQGDITLKFENVHSTKFELPRDNIEAIARIIHLWQHRNDWKLGGN